MQALYRPFQHPLRVVNYLARVQYHPRRTRVLGVQLGLERPPAPVEVSVGGPDAVGVDGCVWGVWHW